MFMSNVRIIPLIKSILSAAIGVQSEENRRKEFEQGSLATYVIAGVIFTALFVGCIILIVSMVL